MAISRHGVARNRCPLYPQERTPGRARVALTQATEPRVAVSYEGPGEPIVLKVHGPTGEVAVPMVPKRALELAQDLLTRGVQAIKADWPDTPLPRRGPDLGAVGGGE